jgi:nitronate monooxygenase
VAAGYKTAQAMRGDIDAVTAMTSEPYGVNVFVPGAPADPDGVARYLDSIAADAAALGTEPGPASTIGTRRSLTCWPARSRS